MTACRSQVRDLVLHSPVLGRPWPYRVYEPASSAHLTLPILYLLHGRQADCTIWTHEGHLAEHLDEEIAAGRVPPLRAVMPDAGESWYVDGPEAPLETAFFADFMPQVEARYPPVAGRRSRWLAGYSMGGYGALRYLLTRRHLFGAAVLLSPAVYSGLPPAESTIPGQGAFGRPFDAARWTALNYPAQLVAGLRPTSVFIGVGDADRAHSDPTANVEVQSALLHARLRGLGVASHLRVWPGGHDWSVWRPALIEGLRTTAAWL
ncbi:alpha/beta hydrolase [Deinococcus frigens]|uniref:alpha/beta hydrolase n=1 Tax=Deinococcus frigens TaxID=249403 RepID=UPI0006906753|nr:alpha/beta hydrolase-fold protein [Deinococcus frigens]